MQYQTYTDGDLTTYTDGVTIFRNGSRDLFFALDKVLSPTGFAGVENVDWENVYLLALIGVTGVFRDGVRSGAFVLDETITPLGFAGVESVDGGLTGDWINVHNFE